MKSNEYYTAFLSKFSTASLLETPDDDDGFIDEMEDIEDAKEAEEACKIKLPRIMIADLPVGYENSYPWKNGDSVLVLSEIQNMKHHYVVVFNYKTYVGYHIDSFRERTEDEL